MKSQVTPTLEKCPFVHKLEGTFGYTSSRFSLQWYNLPILRLFLEMLLDSIHGLCQVIVADKSNQFNGPIASFPHSHLVPRAENYGLPTVAYREARALPSPLPLPPL